MAGLPSGAPSPTSSLTLQPAPHQAPTTTRRRRNHGVFLLGGHLACVYSSRSAQSRYGVSLELGAGSLNLAGSMTPAQARLLASALVQAADTAAAKATKTAEVQHG